MAHITGGARAPVPDYSPESFVYLARVRQASRRLSDPRPPSGDEEALGALEAASHFDAEVPTHSPRPEVQALKVGVKRLASWYMRYLSAQLNSFSSSLLAWAGALSSRTGDLEAGVDELAAHLGALEERLSRLEAAQGRPSAAVPAPATPPRTTGSPARTTGTPARGNAQGRRPPRKRGEPR